MNGKSYFAGLLPGPSRKSGREFTHIIIDEIEPIMDEDLVPQQEPTPDEQINNRAARRKRKALERRRET